MQKIVDAITALPEKLEKDLFLRIKDKLTKTYKNFLFSQPYQHAFYAADICLENAKWTIEDKIIALADIDLPSLEAFHARLLSRFHLELLVHGNASPSEAKTIATTILDNISPKPVFQSNMPSLRVVQLKKGASYLHRFKEYNSEDVNNCLATILQFGAVSLSTNAIISFLHHLIKEPFFNELRTKEQLGYIVHSSIKTNGNNIKSMLFLIQSDAFDPMHLDNRVEAFIIRFRDHLVKMTDEEFETNIDSVVKEFHEKNKNLGEESGRYWSAISNNTYLFRKYQLIGDEVKQIKKRQILIFFDKFISKQSDHRSKLCIQVFGKNHAALMDTQMEEGVELIKSDGIAQFKRKMPLFALSEEVDLEGMKM